MNPTFDSGVTHYTVNVTNLVTSVEVTPIVNNCNAKVTAEGEEVTSGTSKEVPLSVSNNEVNVLVTSEDGNTAETVIEITMAKSSSDNGGRK